MKNKTSGYMTPRKKLFPIAYSLAYPISFVPVFCVLCVQRSVRRCVCSFPTRAECVSTNITNNNKLTLLFDEL